MIHFNMMFKIIYSQISHQQTLLILHVSLKNLQLKKKTNNLYFPSEIISTEKFSSSFLKILSHIPYAIATDTIQW